MRQLLIFLVALNILCAVAVYPLISMATGAGKLYIVSNYRELDKAGLINHEVLKRFREGQFSDDWRSIPDQLGEGGFRYVKETAVIVTGAFALNSLMLAIALFSVLPAKNPDASPVTPEP